MHIFAVKNHKCGNEHIPNDDGRIILSCWEDYIIESSNPLRLPPSCIKYELPAECQFRALLNFGDYIGLFWIDGMCVEVCSSKLDATGFEELLLQITDCIANLPFDVNSPSFVPFSRIDLKERDRLFHAIAYLRWTMWFQKPSLKESWAQIAADPHCTLVREERTVRTEDARCVTPRTLERIAAHPETWVSLPNGSFLETTALGHALVDWNGQHYFPTDVIETVAEKLVDTPENRFIKFFLKIAGELIDRSIDIFQSLPDQQLCEDAKALSKEIGIMDRSRFLKNVGEMKKFPSHSQVLQKRVGYRDILLHYQALSLASRYPIAAADLRRIVETKSASLLYEYWCFFEMADQISRIIDHAPLEGFVAGGDEMHAKLNEGIKLVYPGNIELYYNRSFSPSNSKWKSYSVPLRPDIVLKLDKTLHLFDAKFRIEKWDLDDVILGNVFDDMEADDHSGRTSSKWWKNADIYKMHAYKDALGNEEAHVSTVWVLYPGTEFVFYDDEKGQIQTVEAMCQSNSGVGAIPLSPHAASDMSITSNDLNKVCFRLLNSFIDQK